jgi:RNA polymerase sigma factor (sigma-70 family)
LQDFPGVKRWEQTDDVLQNALVRLMRALEQVQPTSTRQFLGLATLQIRRELLDLAKHYYGPQGAGTHHMSVADGSGIPEVPDRADFSADPKLLAQWREAHEQVERLPPDEREVFNLLYYQGLKPHEVAAILKISRNTVRRRWLQALLQLEHMLGNGD